MVYHVIKKDTAVFIHIEFYKGLKISWVKSIISIHSGFFAVSLPSSTFIVGSQSSNIVVIKEGA